jgi:hypothetical protein
LPIFWSIERRQLTWLVLFGVLAERFFGAVTADHFEGRDTNASIGLNTEALLKM